jgi:hypothetical protein
MSKHKKASAVLETVNLVAKEQSECRKEGYWWAVLDLRDRIGDTARAAQLMAEGKKRFSE